MSLSIELIYCASKNRIFDDIAATAGFRIGAQVPCTVYHTLFFADQNWLKPNRAVYMQELAKHKPILATVLDWERWGQLPEVLGWAEDAAVYAERVLIIPKVPSWDNPITRLPRTIGGKPVVLAYSVPTRFGGSPLPISYFAGWPVHLLGGSPHTQMRLVRDFTGHGATVLSCDGNMANRMATQRGQFWTNGTARHAHDRYWPRLDEAGWYGENAPAEAFRRSCENIMEAWKCH